MNDIDRDYPTGLIDAERYADIASYPGKFEGEPAWVPYFYDKMMDGGYIEWAADERTGECWDILAVEDDEKESFEDYGLDGNYVLLYQRGDGFVIGSQFRTIEEARLHLPDVSYDGDEDDAENNEQTMTRSYDVSEEV